jgi:hypothetical protein
MRFGPITIPALPAVSRPWMLVGHGARQVWSEIDALWGSGGHRRFGVCVACGQPVFEHDAFLRYRGDYYHAGPCIEADPPALRRAAVLRAQRSAG